MADAPSKDASAAAAAAATTAPAAPAAAASTTAFGWWGSLLQEVQGGLSEFVTVVTQDTRAQAEKVERTIEQLQERSVPANQIASELVNTVTRGFGRLLADDSPDSSRTATPARGEVHSDRYRADLETLRRTPATFADEPAPSEGWTAFQATFRLSEQSEEISRLLASHQALRAVHTRLVPAIVAQDVFWLRYFYAVHCLDEDERRRRTLFDGRRTLADDEEPIRWDEDDDEEEEDAKEAEPLLEDVPSDGGVLVAPSVTISASSESLRPSVDAAPKAAAPAAAQLPAPVALGPEVVIVLAPTSSTPSPPSLVGSSAAHSKQPSSDDGFELVRQPAPAPSAGKPQAAVPLPGVSKQAAPAVNSNTDENSEDDEDDDLLRELDDLPDAPPARTGASAAAATDADLGDWE